VRSRWCVGGSRVIFVPRYSLPTAHHMDFVVGGVSSISTAESPHHPHRTDGDHNKKKPSFGPYVLSDTTATLQVILFVTYVYQDGSEYVTPPPQSHPHEEEEQYDGDPGSSTPTRTTSGNHDVGYWQVECSVQFRIAGDPFWGTFGHNSWGPSEECRPLQQTFRIPLVSPQKPSSSAAAAVAADEVVLDGTAQVHWPPISSRKNQSDSTAFPSAPLLPKQLLLFRPTLTLSPDHRSMACVIPSPVPPASKNDDDDDDGGNSSTSSSSASCQQTTILLQFEIYQGLSRQRRRRRRLNQRTNSKREPPPGIKNNTKRQTFPPLPSYVTMQPPTSRRRRSGVTDDDEDDDDDIRRLYFMAKQPRNICLSVGSPSSSSVDNADNNAEEEQQQQKQKSHHPTCVCFLTDDRHGRDDNDNRSSTHNCLLLIGNSDGMIGIQRSIHNNNNNHNNSNRAFDDATATATTTTTFDHYYYSQLFRDGQPLPAVHSIQAQSRGFLSDETTTTNTIFQQQQIAILYANGRVCCYAVEMTTTPMLLRMDNNDWNGGDSRSCRPQNHDSWLRLTHQLPPTCYCFAVKWVDDSRLAVLENDTTAAAAASAIGTVPTRICVYRLLPPTTPNDELKSSDIPLAPVVVLACLLLNYIQLVERCHYTVPPPTTTRMKINDEEDDDDLCAAEPFYLAQRSSITSPILAVSTRCGGQSFSFLWNWQTNVQGFTVQGGGSTNMQYVHDGPGGQSPTKLVLLRRGRATVEKTIFDVAISSSSSSLQLPMTDPFLLSPKAVWLPSIVQRGAIRRLEQKWEQVKLPINDAVLAASSPTCLAVAGHRGLVVLHLSSSSLSSTTADSTDTTTTIADPAHNSFHHISHIMKSGSGVGMKKWIRYKNSCDEQSFRVVAMTVWPSASMMTTTTTDAAHSENLVVTIIESSSADSHTTSEQRPLSSRREDYHLAIWPANNLSHTSQLAVVADQSSSSLTAKPSIGTPLDFVVMTPFRPSTVQIVKNSDTSSSTVFLLIQSSTVWESPYLVYQLEKEDSCAQCRPIAWGKIGAPADLFLAAVQCATDETDNDSPAEYLVTLGVIRKGSTCGLDAMVVSESSVVAVGEVVEPKHLMSTCIASVLPYGGTDSCSWCIRLGDGRLYIWNACNATTIGPSFGPRARSVHPINMSLGFVCSAGNTRQWMMSSDKGSSTAAWLGIVTGRDGNGAVLFSSQAVEKERQELNCFGPQHFGVYPLAQLLTVFSQLDQQKAHTNSCQEFTTINVAFCLQVLLLNAVTSNNTPMVFRVVEYLRQSTTRIQFLNIILKIGRQLEGGYLDQLFPLPGSSPPQHAVDVFDELLILGSSEAAMQAIPLIDDPVMIESKCCQLFHANLNVILQGVSPSADQTNRLCLNDAATTVKALFRYSLKTVDEQDTTPFIEASRYSIFCGMIPGVGRSSSSSSSSRWATKRPALLISPSRVSKQRKIPNGELLLPWSQYPVGYFSAIPFVLARFCVANVFQKSNTEEAWWKLGLVARLMVTGSSLEKHSVSSDLAPILPTLEMDRLGALVGSITDFLICQVPVATAVLSVPQAAIVVDLCSYLIVTYSPSPDTAGLILVHLVACLVAQKQSELAMFATCGIPVLTMALQFFQSNNSVIDVLVV
jgi:hypothetical protein